MFDSPDSAWRLAALFLRCATYAAALVASGSAVFLLLFRSLDPAVLQRVTHFTKGFALLGLLASALAVPLQTGYLAGSGWRGMLDIELLAMVGASPVGWAAAMAAAGSIMLLLATAGRPDGTVLSVVGGAVLLASVTVAGHGAAQNPVVGRALVGVHLAAAAFWIGSLWPLLRIARTRPEPEAASVLERFGRVAVGVVGVLLVAGIALAIVLLDSVAALWQTRYGAILLVKLAIVSALLGLAALNRQRLVPALARGAPHARAALVRSIRAEIVLALLIILTTAVLTTYSTPFT